MTVRVIGLGNPHRGDDAIGPRVIEALADHPPADAALDVGDGDMLDLLERWSDEDSVILVDAMAAENAPGRVRRFDVTTAPLTASLNNFSSSHAFNLAEAVELARALGRLPARLVIFGVEGGRFDTGAALSEAVARAVPAVADLVRKECDTCTKHP